MIPRTRGGDPAGIKGSQADSSPPAWAEASKVTYIVQLEACRSAWMRRVESCLNTLVSSFEGGVEDRLLCQPETASAPLVGRDRVEWIPLALSV